MLDIAIQAGQPGVGEILHADPGAQFTSRAFASEIRDAGLMSAFHATGH